MFGKRRWVKYYKVVFVVSGIKKFESILAERLMSVVVREIQFHVSVGQFDGLSATVNLVYRFSTPSHSIKREAARVAKHVEYRFVFGVTL